MKQTTRTIIYARTSTDRQSISIEAQLDKMQAYAKVYDLQVVSVEVEQASAKSLDRPVLQKALRALQHGDADALLVVKLDRLTRSVRDLGALVEQYFADGQSSLMSVSENIDTRTAAGRLVLNVLASVSQWERETIGERTSVAQQHLKKQRRRHCRIAPFGYTFTSNKELIEEPEEQNVISIAKALRHQGLSFNMAAKELSKKCLWNRRNGCFTAKFVINMLKDAA